MITGDWQIVIKGSGPHHNPNCDADADRVAGDFVRALEQCGAHLERATFQVGSGDEPEFPVEGRTALISKPGCRAVKEGVVRAPAPDPVLKAAFEQQQARGATGPAGEPGINSNAGADAGGGEQTQSALTETNTMTDPTTTDEAPTQTDEKKDGES